MMFITIEPGQLAAEVLSSVNEVIALGYSADSTLEKLAAAVGAGIPQVEQTSLERGEGLLWRLRRREFPIRVRVAPPRANDCRSS